MRRSGVFSVAWASVGVAAILAACGGMGSGQPAASSTTTVASSLQHGFMTAVAPVSAAEAGFEGSLHSVPATSKPANLAGMARSLEGVLATASQKLAALNGSGQVASDLGKLIATQNGQVTDLRSLGSASGVNLTTWLSTTTRDASRVSAASDTVAAELGLRPSAS